MAVTVVQTIFPDWKAPEGWLVDTLGSCRSCKATILWCTTNHGRPAPVNQDGTSHFATCPDAERFRRRKPRGGSY